MMYKILFIHSFPILAVGEGGWIVRQFCWNCLITLKVFNSLSFPMFCLVRLIDCKLYEQISLSNEKKYFDEFLCLCLYVCCFPTHRAAESVTDGSQYFVLLMITDGVISDMVQTKEAVVNVRFCYYFYQCLNMRSEK